MSQHRYPCTAEPPPPILPDTDHHQHACIHDEPVQPAYRPVEHQCACGMTWRMDSDWTPRPAPDTSWVTTEPAEPTGSPWHFLAIIGGILIAGLAVTALFAWLVTR